MNEDEELKAGLLDFLTDNILGRERDAVNRAFYEYAEGDPHSHPVALAVILIACARQMAGLPKRTRDSVKELETLAQRVAQVETDLLERLARENVSTHSALKEEAARLVSQLKTELSQTLSKWTNGNQEVQRVWGETVKSFSEVLTQSQRIYVDLMPIADSAKIIVRDFQSLQTELAGRENSSAKTLEAVQSLKLLFEESQRQAPASQSIINALSRQARANWASLGYAAGLILASFCAYLPWWALWCSLGLGIAGLQWLSRRGTKPLQIATSLPSR